MPTTYKDHLGIDLDDVCLDFYEGLRRAVKVEYGLDIPREDMNKWDLHDVLDPLIGKSWWSWLRERDWLWSHFPAVDGAIGTLDRLRKEGYYLEIITSKPHWAEYAVWRWLGKYRLPVHRVTIVGSDERKIDFTDAAILVDDRPENCQQFVEGGRRGILLDRPHNEGFRFPGVIRAYNWREVYREVTGQVLPGGKYAKT